MPELTKTSPYVHSRVDSNTFTMDNPMPESTLSHSQRLWIWPLVWTSWTVVICAVVFKADSPCPPSEAGTFRPLWASSPLNFSTFTGLSSYLIPAWPPSCLLSCLSSCHLLGNHSGRGRPSSRLRTSGLRSDCPLEDRTVPRQLIQRRHFVGLTEVSRSKRKMSRNPELVFVDLLRSPWIDSLPVGPVRQPYFSYRPDRLHRLAKSILELHKRLQIRALYI